MKSKLPIITIIIIYLVIGLIHHICLLLSNKFRLKDVLSNIFFSWTRWRGFFRKEFSGFPGISLELIPGFSHVFLVILSQVFPGNPRNFSNKVINRIILEISGIPRFSWQFLSEYRPFFSWHFPVISLEKSQVFLGNMYQEFLG